MNEKIDYLSEDFSSINNKELQKELLENPSMNNIYSKDTFDGINEISQLYNDLNYSPINKFDINNLKMNNERINNNNKSNLSNNDQKEQLFIKTFFSYIDSEKINELERIIKSNIEKIISISFDDMNIIQYCSFFNKYNSLKAIINQLIHQFKDKDKISKMINIRNKKGYNALHYSIIKGNNEIYNFLVNNGADNKIMTISGYDNIMLACQSKSTYIFLKEIEMKIINENLNFDSLFEIKDKNNSTLLHWCAFSDFLFGVQFLLNHFRNDKNNIKFISFINYRDNKDTTALQYALMNSSNKVILDLVLLDNVDLTIKDNEGRNCYDYAIAMNNKTFDNIIKLKNYKSNIIKRIIFITTLILFNILVYIIILPEINIFHLKIVQLSLNVFLIIIVLLIKFIINPRLEKGDKEAFNNNLFNLNGNDIQKEIKEINKSCLYCCIKRAKSDIKHCPLCDCCIENILMHDIFLNKCIGNKNFPLFIIYKIMFLVNILFFISLGILIIIKNVDKIIALFEASSSTDKDLIIYISIIVEFLLIILFFFKLWDLYSLFIIKNDSYFSKHQKIKK